MVAAGRTIAVTLAALVGIAVGTALLTAAATAPPARADHRMEVYDTAWSLPVNSSAAEVEAYFDHLERARFSGVWMSLYPFVWQGGLEAPNRAGHAIESFEVPNPAYLAHVDYILDRAAAHGIGVGLAVAWGTDYVGSRPGARGVGETGPAPLTAPIATGFGRLLGERWGGHPAIDTWVLGGDWWEAGTEGATEPVWEGIVAGLRGAGATEPVAYHTGGYDTSWHLFADRDWVDVLAPNTGQCLSPAQAAAVLAELAVTYAKPVIASEMQYEQFAPTWCPDPRVRTAVDVEADAVAAHDAGAAALVYGHAERWSWPEAALDSLGSAGESLVLTAAGAPPPLPSPPAAGPPPGAGLVLVDPSRAEWHLLDGREAVSRFFYGVPGDIPLLGDWDCDGIDTVGMYRPSNGFVYLRNTNDLGTADLELFYGVEGDVPLAGDWDGDGCDTLAIYRSERVFLRNDLATGPAQLVFSFGQAGDRPFAGDFDGDGMDGIGLYRESTGYAYLRNTLASGPAEVEFYYGEPADRIVAADWDGDGIDTVGVFRPAEGVFLLSPVNAAVDADRIVLFGQRDWLPAAGITYLP